MKRVWGRTWADPRSSLCLAAAIAAVGYIVAERRNRGALSDVTAEKAETSSDIAEPGTARSGARLGGGTEKKRRTSG